MNIQMILCHLLWSTQGFKVEKLLPRTGREEGKRGRSADAAIPRVACTFREFLLLVVKIMRVCGAVMECFQEALCDGRIRSSAIFGIFIMKYVMTLYVSF